MSEQVGAAPRPKLPPLLALLAGVVLVEAIAMVAVAAILLIDVLTQPAASLGGGIALVVLAVLAAVWLAAMVLGTLRRRTWVRGAIFTWQLIQLAVAVGAFQGTFARQDIGWLLLIPSVAAIALLFTPSVMNSTRRAS
ncbi:hypothetical protein [Naasia sp. SYSU D00948]|uniref:hypothetical protein n=1 Tax=Naasia sp. SYSU D00948 TaxID=2817379 RepID=UPI0027DC79ED|nr:hypothetical protein [Naasia sp. SYSU D00948]